MLRSLCTILLCSLFFSAIAQDEDSLFVINKNKSWIMPYTTAKNETVFMVARRFHVPPAVLGSLNNTDFKSTFPPHTQITVPISAYNFMREKMNDMNDALPLYYKVTDDDDLAHICHISGVSQQVMERWNNLPDNNIYIGQALFIGWVLYDATSGNKGIVANVENPITQNNAAQKKNNTQKLNNTPQQKPNPEAQWPVAKQKEQKTGPTIVPDPPVHEPVTKVPPPSTATTTKKHDTVFLNKRNVDTVKRSPLEAVFLEQTGNGVNIAEEKGSVAFFNTTGTANVYYVLHNDIERGAIIRVHNPGNDKMIYAKVIGTLPATKQYYNCIMALSGNAKEELGVKEDKIWCEIFYRQNK